MKKLLKKIKIFVGITFLVFAGFVIFTNLQIDKEIEPLVNKEFKGLKWEMDSNYPKFLGSEVESRFKNNTGYSLDLKIGYKLKDYDGTILEEGTTDTIYLNPNDKKMIEISFEYSDVTIDNIEFELLSY